MVSTKLMRAQGSKAPRRHLGENRDALGMENAPPDAEMLTPAQIRERNIRENMKMLEELGVMESFAELEVIFYSFIAIISPNWLAQNWSFKVQ